jgi:hypothetical protein
MSAEGARRRKLAENVFAWLLFFVLIFAMWAAAGYDVQHDAQGRAQIVFQSRLDLYVCLIAVVVAYFWIWRLPEGLRKVGWVFAFILAYFGMFVSLCGALGEGHVCIGLGIALALVTEL